MAHALGVHAMTAAYIPTVGEYAGRALLNFAALRHAPTVGGQPTAEARHASVELTSAALALLSKLPEGSRAQLAGELPFSRLELELFRCGKIDDEYVASALASRLVEWANRSPILVDEANVHAADFLADLYPLLDAWSERQQADDMRTRLLNV